ncbi:MAG: hydrogenase maturation protein HypF [Planctomycetota bacterium]|nr:MAG: hydrogenase maturation protein HypF [Planctomycetota bacterium]
MLIGRRILLEGRVQGLGIRPAIARLAMRHHLGGKVRNRRDGVEVEIHGSASDVEAFERDLPSSLPAGSEIQLRSSEEIEATVPSDFQIDSGDADGALRTAVPPDVAMCSECQCEVTDPANRRYGYAMTTCAGCGPRFSVLTAMPFERETTTLRSFSLCSECTREFTNPGNRRFHAQTMACPNCGPRVWTADREGRVLGSDRAAIEVVVAALRRGQIVALRGVGGYQLLCDATSSVAVARLRQRKQRPSKPLAVMVGSLQAARAIASVTDVETKWLTSRENPIVLVTTRADLDLATEIHPGLREVGVLLPSSPLHWSIAREFGRPFVATSGNREGEPLVVEITDAESQLADIADVWLHHDRPIANAVDDSVVRVIANRPVLLRMARGFAPLVLPEWPGGKRFATPLLATGGHLKNAVALDNGEQALLGPHVGDLDNERTRQRFVRHVAQLTRLFGGEEFDIVHDLHPAYFTTEWAGQQNRRTIAVQHHHAHLAAACWEHGWLDREVLGFAWDGTGFGEDSSIWGGETLRVCGARCERVGSCRPFRLPGGEAAIREPWRVAVVLLREAVGDAAAREFAARLLPRAEADRFLAVAVADRFSPVCTSIGRLFDGMAALVLGVTHSEFEAQAALARFVAETARTFSDLPLVLAGGAFQNRVLVESIVEQLGSASNRLGLPGMIPPNDGGLAAGQLAVARMRFWSLEGV